MHWNIDPIIFKFGIFQLRYYSIMWVIGLFTAYYLCAKLMKERGMPETYPDSLLLYEVISIVLGAHLVHLIFYEPASFVDDASRFFHFFGSLFSFSFGEAWMYLSEIRLLQIGSGLASHGGVTGAILGLYLFSKKNGESFWEFADMLATTGVFTGACIRIGNFFNSEIIGHPTDFPLAVVFEARDQFPRHPSQLYEAFFLLVMFAIIFPLYKRNWETRSPGFYLFLILAIYFTFRFFIEFTKELQSQLSGAESVLTMGQWLSIPVVLISLYMLFRKREA